MIIPVLSSSSLISWATPLVVLLVITDPVLFQKTIEVAKSISITCIQSIPPKLSHLALSHELHLIHLSRCELDLGWINSA